MNAPKHSIHMACTTRVTMARSIKNQNLRRVKALASVIREDESKPLLDFLPFPTPSHNLVASRMSEVWAL